MPLVFGIYSYAYCICPAETATVQGSLACLTCSLNHRFMVMIIIVKLHVLEFWAAQITLCDATFILLCIYYPGSRIIGYRTLVKLLHRIVMYCNMSKKSIIVIAGEIRTQ